MALIKCSECQKEISDKAEVCPQCGSPVTLVQQKQDFSSHNYENPIRENVDNQTDIGTGNKNKVAERLNKIGNTLFGIAAVISGIAILASLGMLNEGGFSAMVGLPMLVTALFFYLIFYVIKILFNGLAENIQILHDIRNDIRSNNNK